MPDQIRRVDYYTALIPNKPGKGRAFSPRSSKRASI